MQSTRFFPLLWSCLIIVGSIVPFRFKRHGALQGQFHRTIHVIAFLATVVVFSVSAKTGKSRLVYSGLAICLAVSSEWLERMVYHNQFEWADVVLDLGGVAIGLSVVAAVRSLSRNRSLDHKRPDHG
jgi:hypothetical protein